MMLALCFILFAALVVAWLAAPTTTAPTAATEGSLSPAPLGAD